MMLTCQSLLTIQKRVAEARGDGARVLAIVVDEAPSAFPQATGAVVELLDGDMLTYAAASGPSAAFIGFSLKLEGSFSGSCFLTGTPALCNDSESDPRVDRDACRRIGVRSMVAVPLFVGDSVRGVLKIYSAAPGAFDDRDVLSASMLASPIAYGLSDIATQEVTRRFQATFEQAAVGIAHVSPCGEFLRVNDRFCAISGRSAAELLGGGFQRITHPDDLQADLDQIARLIEGRTQSYSMEKRYLHPSGGIVWVNLTVSLVRLPDGAPEFFVAVIEDITARKAAEELSAFDPLTGLPNRRRIEALIDEVLDSRDGCEGPTVIAFLDLDNFKSVNDTLGHAEGDRCLNTVAQALQQQLRHGDIVGRMGGDEFVIIMKNSSRQEAANVLARLDRHITDLGAQHGWRIGLSAGAIAVEQGSTLPSESLLKSADVLMYAAKRSRNDALRAGPSDLTGQRANRVFSVEDAGALDPRRTVFAESGN